MGLDLALVAISVSILAFGFISNKSESHSVTAPMIFVTIGLVASVFGFIEIDLSHGFIHGFMEMTLILVLFTDASRINLKLLVSQHGLPMRMLLIGMPLTIIMGGFAAQWFFGFEQLWWAFLLAAILAPTDAALGQVVVSSKIIPVRIRQSLNVESGLNDGIAVPIILIFIVIVQTKLGFSGEGHADTSVAHWALFAGKQVILGPITGIVIGLLGGKLIHAAAKSSWMNSTYQDLGLLSLSFLAFGAAEMIGGNGFIAAFSAGLTVGNTAKGLCSCLYEFAESEGQLLTLIVFLILGSVILPQIGTDSILIIVMYSLVSLTVIRMIPVSLSLIGTKLKPQSHLFLGWFGPRGLASIIFGLLMLEELHGETAELLFSVILVTVFLSIFLHGITAGPFAKLYSNSLKKHKVDCEEDLAVNEMPVKNTSLTE